MWLISYTKENEYLDYFVSKRKQTIKKYANIKIKKSGINYTIVNGPYYFFEVKQIDLIEIVYKDNVYIGTMITPAKREIELFLKGKRTFKWYLDYMKVMLQTTHRVLFKIDDKLIMEDIVAFIITLGYDITLKE